ncbi:hypothetical protein Ancab_007230, partial [Ancistrocladus abbreviatus]
QHGQRSSLSPPKMSPSPPQSPPNTSISPIINAGAWSPTRQISLQQPSQKKNSQSRNKILRRVRSVFRSFPIITPTCRIPVSSKLHDGHVHGGTRITGTLFGYRKARINLAFQENPRCLPMLLLELAIPTGKLLQDMGLGLVRIALECEKRPSEKTKLIDEPIWTMYCNGRKSGYGIKREPTDEDLSVMQMLHAVSMGAGVLPSESLELPDGELTYMRAFFERVVGSRDSETYYMVNPDGNSGPELSMFFVRV